MARFYERGLDGVLRHPVLTLAATIATMGATVYCYAIIPKGFFPQEDTGLIIGVIAAVVVVGSVGTALFVRSRRLSGGTG